MACSYDGEFGARRSIFKNGNALLRGCEDCHSLRHAEFDRALHIFQHELRFDRQKIGMMFFDEDLQAFKNDAVALGERQSTRRADAAVIDGQNARPLFLDEAVAGNDGARIDAKDDHEQICTRSTGLCHL
jgi:hypothetical protein